MNSSSKTRHFKLDEIVPNVRAFLNGDFITWCKLISFKGFRPFDDPLFGEIESPEMGIIGESFTRFQTIATQLKNHVEEVYESESEQQKDLLISELLSVKEQFDALSSEDSINTILKGINHEAQKYFIKDVDYIDEETGEIVTIKKFSRKTAFINPDDFDIYRMYFRIAVRELSFRLNTYCVHLRETRIAADERHQLLANTKELIEDFKQRKELTNLHSKRKVIKCFSLIFYGYSSHTNEVKEWLKKLYKELVNNNIINPLNEKPDVSLKHFMSIFIQNQKVYHKIPWRLSNSALKEFIIRIRPFLGDEPRESPFAVAGLCFQKYNDANYKYTSENIRNSKANASKEDMETFNNIFNSLPAIPKNPHPPRRRNIS